MGLRVEFRYYFMKEMIKKTEVKKEINIYPNFFDKAVFYGIIIYLFYLSNINTYAKIILVLAIGFGILQTLVYTTINSDKIKFRYPYRFVNRYIFINVNEIRYVFLEKRSMSTRSNYTFTISYNDSEKDLAVERVSKLDEILDILVSKNIQLSDNGEGLLDRYFERINKKR